MDRRLLFPALAATAWAQQTSPAQAAADKALRARLNQFYQLMVEKNVPRSPRIWWRLIRGTITTTVPSRT